jgi:hypothetical protein
MTEWHVPWRKQTPQAQGRTTEKRVLKSLGANVHPMSGAGRIKGDGSTKDFLYEVKESRKQFTLSLSLVKIMWRRAAKEGKDPLVIVKYPGYLVTMTIEKVREVQ